MDYPLQNRRLLFVTFLTILAFCGLAYRLVDLHAFDVINFPISFPFWS